MTVKYGKIYVKDSQGNPIQFIPEGTVAPSTISSVASELISSGGYVTTSEVESIVSNQVSSGGYAVDSNTVHISGNETIIGEKTFSGGVTAPHYYVGYEGISPLHPNYGMYIQGTDPGELDNANIYVGRNEITLTGDGGSGSGHITLNAPYIGIFGNVSTTLGYTRIYNGASIYDGATADTLTVTSGATVN